MFIVIVLDDVVIASVAKNVELLYVKFKTIVFPDAVKTDAIIDDVNIAKKLLRSFLYEYGNKEFFIKVKRTNPLGRIAQSLGFIFLGGRGTEILLMRKAEKIFRYSNRDKDEDSNNLRQY